MDLPAWSYVCSNNITFNFFISSGVVETSNGEEPIDAKESKMQRF
jgi:hypothetical protein